MANKVIIREKLQHYYDEYPEIQEPDKTKSISELSTAELKSMIGRIGRERELQSLLLDIKRNSGEQPDYESPLKVSTKTPIDQLYHHGVLGMKWGVRRYQNKDGTRTAAGKRRERQDTKTKTQDSNKSTKSKSISELSNDELRKLNERLQLEENYKRLTSSTQIKKGQSWVKKSLASASEQALTEFSKGLMLGSAKLLVKELSPQFAEAAFKIKDKDKDKN